MKLHNHPTVCVHSGSSHLAGVPRCPDDRYRSLRDVFAFADAQKSCEFWMVSGEIRFVVRRPLSLVAVLRRLLPDRRGADVLP